MKGIKWDEPLIVKPCGTQPGIVPIGGIKDKFKLVSCKYVIHGTGSSCAPDCRDFPNKCWDCSRNKTDLNKKINVNERPTHFLPKGVKERKF